MTPIEFKSAFAAACSKISSSLSTPTTRYAFELKGMEGEGGQRERGQGVEGVGKSVGGR